LSTTPVDSGTETLRAEIVDGVGVIELNRPERRNALHADMYEAIPKLIERYEADDDVGCMLLTGAGKAFCAGGDIQGGAGQGGRDLAADARIIVMFQESPKISIAALPGAAAGAGIAFALAPDFRIAAQSAKLVTAYAALAFSGDFGVTWLLTRFLGASKALEMLVDNAPIDSATALSLGLFNRVVPDEELRDAAMDWARTIAAGPRNAFRSMKENVRDAERLSLREAIPPEADRMAVASQSEEHREARKRWLDAAKARRGGG
jgi:2-(1,2-epoxy-1,2-dihydrophenyl)acetyl-CoA isomerase